MHWRLLYCPQAWSSAELWMFVASLLSPCALCAQATRSGWHLPPPAGNIRHWPHPSLDVKNRTGNFPWRKLPHCKERALILPLALPSLCLAPAADVVRSARGKTAGTRRETVLG